MTSSRDGREDDNDVTLNRKKKTKNKPNARRHSVQFVQLTVVTVFTRSSRVRLTTGDQWVHAQDGCGEKQQSERQGSHLNQSWEE